MTDSAWKKSLKEITSDKLYVKNAINQESLLSEVIFGPTRDYKCSCGKYSFKHIHGEQICPSCNVKCTSSDIRYNTFAKINLPFCIINTFKKNDFNSITGKNFKNFLSPTQYDLFSSLKLFISYEQVTDAIRISNKFTSDSLPFKLNGIYSLFIALNVISEVYKSEKAEDLLKSFYNEILVIPPETRVTLLVEDTRRKLIKHKITEIYIEIIRNKNYILKENKNIELSIRKHINNLKLLTIQNRKDVILNDPEIAMYDLFVTRFQHYADVLYSEVLNVLSKKNGIIRTDFLGKNIDFCARAVVVNDPSLPTHQIKLPKKAFLKLWFLEYIKFLNDFKYDIEGEGIVSQNFSRYILRQVTNTENYIDFNNYEYFDDFIYHFFNNTKQKERLIYINRQPTLWRYGLLSVEIAGLNDEDVISVSPMIIKSLGMDFDGDTAAVYKVHDKKSIDESYENSFIMNLIEYDHNDDFITDISNENKYVYELLKMSKIDNNSDILMTSENLFKLKYDYTIDIKTAVFIKNLNITMPYGHGLLNKWAGLNAYTINENTSSADALRAIFKNSNSNEHFHQNLKRFVSSLYWFLSTHQKETLTLPFIESCELIHQVNENKILNKLPKNPYLGHYIYTAVTNNIYNTLPEDYQLYKLTKSKFRKVQFLRSLISIGYIADEKNMISPTPVTNNILSGLTEDEFFETSFGTRKGIVDKEKNVPDSGYMQRSMVINLSSLEIVEEDCKTKVGFKIKIQNKTHNRSLLNRYYFDSNGKMVLYDESHTLNDDNIGKSFLFRSPITCQTPHFKVCRCCTGVQKFKSPFIGVMAGQYIEERLTQLTMSSFHTSGSATIEVNPDILAYIKENLTDIETIDNEIYLIFNSIIPDNILELFKSIEQFSFISKDSDRVLKFKQIDHKINNEDVGKIIKKMNKILSTQLFKNTIMPIDHAYYESIDAIHRISNLYSVFIELLFANTYVNKNSKIIRYAIRDKEDITPFKKYNIKQLHMLQSKTLSLLYEPNRSTILKYKDRPLIEKDSHKARTVFERIWRGEL